MSVHIHKGVCGGCEQLLWKRCEGAPEPWLVDILSISMVLLTNGRMLYCAQEKKWGVNRRSKQRGEEAGDGGAVCVT